LENGVKEKILSHDTLPHFAP